MQREFEERVKFARHVLQQRALGSDWLLALSTLYGCLAHGLRSAKTGGETSTPILAQSMRLKDILCLLGREDKLYSDIKAIKEEIEKRKLKRNKDIQELYLSNNFIEDWEPNLLSYNYLFHNPLAQDPEYRLFIIFRLPSVQLLDRQEVLRCERIQSTAQYDEKNELVRNNIAFGRRSEGPPSICYPRPLANPLCTDPVDFEFGNNYYRNNPPFETENEAVTLRAVNRSIMEYTALDWSKVPRGQQRRLAAQDYNSPQTITTRFR
ncbi:hypothetical protein CAPTEDRAFT_220952 [Capitella teleta]|uniref:Uncharacterized protein n=1 Tax=Capitella teleta TaxID=283909 RepID=R7VLB8_CAPTE|nr:hypothetical protein CAPTEDRAFT_220952 [Capitella teleta]|eukprot:ELU18116.1 hypothetical protein CAPTEDRAFT_220952 [Capitella teleta]